MLRKLSCYPVLTASLFMIYSARDRRTPAELGVNPIELSEIGDVLFPKDKTHFILPADMGGKKPFDVIISRKRLTYIF